MKRMHSNYKGTIDIFVICYERTPMLEQCLDSIHKCTAASIEYRLVVIEGKRSAATNRNIALSKVTSPWFVMMDDDVIVTPGWLDTMLIFIEDSVGQIQPQLLLPNAKVFAAEKVFTTPWGDNMAVGMGEEEKGQFGYIRTAELLSGTCCLYNSRIIDTCFFDINYKGAQWEDCDFSMQIRRQGLYLLYCGKATVYHHNLYRNPSNKNYTYFINKWFGKRELTRRGVLYVGRACDLDCIFCYYKHGQLKKFRPLQGLEQECDIFNKFYGNTHVDITGGEPTIYPKITELVKHCRSINLLPTIITHGQRLSKELVGRLKQAGIEDFLVSYHGSEEVHDYLTQKKGGYRLMRAGIENIANAEVPFRTNTVVTKYNYRSLPTLARDFMDLGQQVINFIMFNPFEEWISVKGQDFQAQYSHAAPYLMEAVSLLSSQGIEVHVRYMPLCLVPGFEKYVMNFPQLPFDKWEWDFKCGHLLRSEYDYLYYALKESCARYEQGPPCQRCSLRLICSGLPKQYARELGWDELKPRDGMIVRDPIHFNTMKVEVVPSALSKQLPFANTVEDLSTFYGCLKDTDPLVLYQVTPIDQIKPLHRAKGLLIKATLEKCIHIASFLGARWLKQRLPRRMQLWINSFFQRANSW